MPRPVPLCRVLFALALVVIALSHLSLVAASRKVVVSWGNKNYTGSTSTHGAHQLPTELYTSSQGAPLPSFADVVSKRDLTLALSETGELWIWGQYNGARMLPRNVSSTLAPPERLVKIDGAGFAFFGISATGNVYSWTWSPLFRLTLWPILGRPMPSDLAQLQVPTLVQLNESATLASFACSDTFCLGIDATAAGKLHMWADGSALSLSMPGVDIYTSANSIDTSLPFTIPLPNATDRVLTIAPGYGWFFLTTDSGDIYSCGVNDQGQLGLNSYGPTKYFMAKHENQAQLKAYFNSGAGSDAPLSIAAGRSHALYVIGSASQLTTPDGFRLAVYGWGQNQKHQLGNSTSDSSVVPVPIWIPTSEPIAKVSAVLDSSFALTAFGTVFAWGSSSRCEMSYGCSENAFGMLGPLSYTFIHPTPFVVPIPSGLVALSLPQQPISPVSGEDYSLFWHNWAMNIIALDNSATPSTVSPPASPAAAPAQTVASWGSTTILTGNAFPYVMQISAPSGNPNARDQDIAQLYGAQIAQLPSSVVSIKQVSHQQTSVRVLANVNKPAGGVEQRVFVWGLLEDPQNPVSMTLTIPIPANANGSSDHSMDFISAPLDITDLFPAPQDGVTLKTNITSMSANLHSMAVLFGDGSIVTYFQNTPTDMASEHAHLKNWTASPASRVECGSDFCVYYDAVAHTVSPWVDKTLSATDPIAGRTQNDQLSNPPFVILPANVPGTVINVAAGDHFIVAVTNDTNAIWTWGDTSRGQAQIRDDKLDYGYDPISLNVTHLNSQASQAGITINAPFHGSNVLSICAGRTHALALLGQQVIAWGSDNTFGQVGPFDLAEGSLQVLPSVFPASYFPSSAATPKFWSVSCVRDTSFLHTDSGIFVWGYNGVGEVFGPGLHPHVYSSAGATSAYLTASLPSIGLLQLWSSSTGYSALSTIAPPSDIFTNPPASADVYATQSTRSPILTFGVDRDTHFPLTFEPSETAFGAAMAPGEIDPSATISFYTSTSLVRYFVTSEKQIYVSGDVDYSPVFTPVYTTWDWTFKDRVFQRPRLVYSYPSNTTARIIDAQAFGEGLALLLSNGTVQYLTATDAQKDPLGLLDINHALTTVGMQTLNVNGETNLRISTMSCDYWTCCFRDWNQTISCWGTLGADAPFPAKKRDSQGTKVQLITSSTPTISFSDPSFVYLSVFSSRGGLVTSRIDGTVQFITFNWWSSFSLDTTTDITGDLLGYDAKKFTSGVAHLAVLTNSHGILVSGLNDSSVEWTLGFGQLRYSPLTPLRWFHNDVFNSNVVDLSSAAYAIYWYTSSGEVWTAGLAAAPATFDADWTPPVPPGFTYGYWPNPTRFPFDSASYSIVQLFERRCYNERLYSSSLRLPTTFNVRASRASVPSAGPSPISSPAVACLGDNPSPSACSCFDGSWHCTGTVSPPANSKISASIVVDGDFVVSNPGVALIIPADVIANAPSKQDPNLPGNRPIIDVNGCLSLLAPITVTLSTNKAVESIPAKSGNNEGGKTVNLIESRCKQSQNPASLISVSQTAKKCRHIAGQVSESPSNIATGKTSLSVLFKVSSDSCSYWWIILISILGCIFVIVPVILMVFYKIGVLHTLIHPFKGTNM